MLFRITKSTAGAPVSLIGRHPHQPPSDSVYREAELLLHQILRAHPEASAILRRNCHPFLGSFQPMPGAGVGKRYGTWPTV
jgi:hypothetical protein